MKKLDNLKKVLLLFIILISYIGLSVYTPSHILSMSKGHDMNMSKENCPFIVADEVICNTAIKKDNTFLNINNFIFKNLDSLLTTKTIILNLYLVLFSLFLLFSIRSKNSFKIPILLQKLFSKGILNSKAY